LDTDLLQGFYIGELHVDPRDGQVVGGFGVRHLAPRAMEVLLCLASSPGRVLTHEELIESVWGAGNGSSEALTHCIGDIRRALGDRPERPVYIQTLPRRGYRLMLQPSSEGGRHEAEVASRASRDAAVRVGFVENLSQRGVLETAVAYLVSGWLIIQVADIVFDRLLLPEWAATFVTTFVIAGFPISIVLSWFLEFRNGRAIVHEITEADLTRRRFGRRYVAVIGALAIAAGLVTVYDRSVGLPRAVQVAGADDVDTQILPVRDNSIAVLPFLNVDGSADTEIFANGLVDDVLTSLSRVPGLLVASRGDSYTLEPNSASMRVRERLRVARYVEGSIETNDGDMRVTVQLIDSATGFHLLSRTFDREPADYFDMRDEITRLIVANVRVALPPETRIAQTLLAADPSIDVYVLYRRGIDASREPDTAGSVDEIISWFDAALEIDPGYAAAQAGKCSVFVDAYKLTFEASYISAAENACASALSLNPNLDVVYAALGQLYQETGQYDSAEASYGEALKIDSGSTASLIGLGEVYRLQQRFDEAEASLRRATGLHPGDWLAYNALGNFLYRSGRYREAAEQYRYVVALDGTNGLARTNLATTLMLDGKFAEAESEYRRVIELNDVASAYTNLGLLLYYDGRYEESINAHRHAVELTPQNYLAHSNLGDALRVSGRVEESIDEFSIARELASSARTINPNDAFIMMDMAWIEAVLGDIESAKNMITRAGELVPDDPYVHYINALISNLTGNTGAAVDALELAVANGYSPQMLAADPNLTGLRSSARFARFLAQSD